jgi:hypothetical protein
MVTLDKFIERLKELRKTRPGTSRVEVGDAEPVVSVVYRGDEAVILIHE